ncbi:patatin-like phospholipase family protein [Colwellia echini]|uniref:Patatin n=1 Tax=Colwellia echini TaxID=1982103 RepID=A0ABY3MYU3_9GAMM|nr:patatin-like phospholipase family protein [Colwellia echini]TYK66344.1 patatin [Colwellia echini]
MRFILTIISLQLLSLSFLVEARDKIGLVLSGGGAKGSAHVGVLKVLEQNNIPIDYIAGTSIGSYVAGMYALGYSADEIEVIMLGLPWSDSYSDEIPRQSLSYNNKQHRDVYNFALRVGYSDGQFKVPQGLLLGQSAYQVFQLSTGPVTTFTSFDDLAIPYRAVASNIATAKKVVLESGNIDVVMKASASVPGVYAATNINGELLVDGGITDNMPVDVIKAMGADIVIAVDIGSPLVNKQELTSAVAVLNQLSTVLTNNTTLAQKSLLDKKDIFLRPAIDKLGTGDWSILPQALKLGEQEANSKLALLKPLSINDEDYQAHVHQKKLKAKQWFDEFPQNIKEIHIRNNSQVADDIILEHFDVQLGKPITKEALNLAISRVYALDAFEQVTVEFSEAPDGRIITLIAEAKSWGPNYLDLGFNLKMDFGNRAFAFVNASYLMTDLNSYGGRWLNELEFGWESMIATEFYQPIIKEFDLYSRARVGFQQDKWQENNTRQELVNDFYFSTLALGYDYSFDGIVEFGVLAETGDVSVESSSLDNLEYNTYGTYLTFGYDTLNSINFPTAGNKLLIKMQWLNDKYLPETEPTRRDSAQIFSFDWRGAFGFSGHSFVGIASFYTMNNEDDFSVHITELGGFLNLSGYSQDALIGVDKVFAAAVYQYDLGYDIPGSSGLPIYLGASIEAGNIWHADEIVDYTDLIYSNSIYVGTNTGYGPVALGVGYATGGQYTFFFSLGKSW